MTSFHPLAATTVSKVRDLPWAGTHSRDKGGVWWWGGGGEAKTATPGLSASTLMRQDKTDVHMQKPHCRKTSQKARNKIASVDLNTHS